VEDHLEGLLTLFVAITALAVMTQAGVLVAIYILSKRLSDQVDRFMRDTRELMGPLKSVTENLKAASTNVVELGMSAREQFRRVEAMVTDTGDVLNVQLQRLDRVSQDMVHRISETADIVQGSVLRPVREVAAVFKGVSRGFETFLFRKSRTVDQAHQDEELFI
jgi:hypothetical protein